MKIGFVGLGNMGLPMALNLHGAGFEVYGLNRSPHKEQLFAAKGGKVGLTLSELAQQMDVIITCLPLPADVEEVYLGEAGLVQSARKGLILIDCSTVSPQLNQQVYAKADQAGCHFLDAPVSGGTVGAADGTLSIMVGGEQQVYEQIVTVLQALGEHIYYVGPSGSGSAVKLINQLMVGVHSQAVSEAYALGQKMGLDSDQLFDILDNSFAQSRIMHRHYTQFIAKQVTEPGFAINLLSKDVNLVADMAGQVGVDLLAGKRAQAILNRAVENNYGEQDMSALYHYQLARDEQQRKTGEIKYYAVFLPMLDEHKSTTYRAQHLQFLADRRKEGTIYANGRFVDGAGGLVIYRGSSYEEVEKLVQQDPYVELGARSYEIHEWDIVLTEG